MARPARRENKSGPAPRALTVRIKTIGARGDGLAESEDGGNLHVPLSAPGDLLRVDARGDRAAIVEIVESGPSRVPPPCAHFGDCGGCALQHIAHEAYSAWKRDQIGVALARAGVAAEAINPVISMPAASRRRAVFAVSKRGGDGVLGFHARQSDRIVAIRDCGVLAPGLSSRLEALRMLAAAIPSRAFDLGVTLCDNGLDINVVDARIDLLSMTATQKLSPLLRAAGAVRLSLNCAVALEFSAPLVTFDGAPVSPPPGAFLQASIEGEAALIALVRSGVAGNRKIADLFAGCGTFSLPLAHSASILAIDSDRAAIEALKRANGAAQGAGLAIKALRTEVRDLFERPLGAKDLKDFDAIVFDPPRAGASVQCAEIAKSGVARVVAVSCNPATFARDAGLLVAGGYRLIEVTPVDQFVYSPHIELVGVFAKR
ncbi:MAG: class I SAM-dependent RNA methyltransferase [Parvularculaceae bacterium]